MKKSPGARTGPAIGWLGFANGAMEPNAGARAPELQRNTRANDATLSLGWAGWPIGMWLASMVGGKLLEKFGARTIVTAGGVLYFGPFMALGYVTHIAVLGALLFVIGLGNGLFDVGWARLAAHYDHQEHRAKGDRAGLVVHLLNGLFSLGSVVAAACGLLVVLFHVPLGTHLLAVGAFGLVVLLWGVRHLPNPGATEVDVVRGTAVAADEPGTSAAPRSRAPWRLRAVAIMCACATLPVGVGYLWSSIYLTRMGASPAVATGGLIAFTAAETIVRLSLGVLSKRLAFLRDVVRQARVGGVLALVGLALVVVPATIPTAIAGFALLAAGLAPIGPLAQRAAPDIWPDHKGLASAMVSRYMYTALVAGPVIIGPLSTGLGSSDTVGPLRAALASLVVLPIVVLALASRLRGPAQA